MRLVSLFVLIAGAWFVFHGELTHGDFVGFLLLVNVFFRPIEKINAVIETYPKGIAGFKRYLEMMDTEPDIADAPGAIEVARLRGEIRYERRDLRLRPAAPVLQRHQSDHPRRARRSPSSGRRARARPRSAACCRASTMWMAGADHGRRPSTSARMTLASLRRQIGIVQQDVFLFFGTIRENIAYGKPRRDRGRDLDGGAAGASRRLSQTCRTGWTR